MATKLIQFSLAEELLKRLDIAADEEYCSRSEFIRQAILHYLKLLDEHRVRLAAAALNTNIPTEQEILRLIRLKQGKRWARQWLRELRSSGEGCKD